MQTEGFGCEHCWPVDAHAAWEVHRARENQGGLTRLEELIVKSHFYVKLLACPRCAQRYVSVFTEMIDWDHGDDSQYCTHLPIMEDEAESLIRQRTSLTEIEIEALGPARRSLNHDHPTGGSPRVYWGSGILIETYG